ncbi:WD40 repeat domain-containing serine/threonine-protein kinase [Leptothoe sp. PORK10 BA2]|uniref:WD40 repeat domain-containing serine/threonine-protein kinase n=1 Tax=Leptothoe sp. PORK10 BA2 TaxID=3110254 RepID=UPI002B1FDA10|nr:WD40 repeat domain-containing serine/threonine-protein kinase [Leptothoe sp. PORK10 BA2]MEA5462302.1 WD40 repeat domain-containing serine/threonine-protein kinase [Leptothoe sp. PORK10 BA2]
MRMNHRESYEIVKHLGKGPSGNTVLARLIHPNGPQTTVVIKQIAQPQEPLTDLTQRLKALGQHPQLPALLDSWQSPDGQFLVFEHITAPPVSQTEPPPWPPAQVETLLLSLLPVLEHIHSFRLVHGDIRPANIRQGPQPLLVDLRITQRLEKQSRPNSQGPGLLTTGGDAAYAAPEQALGRLVYASDLYSLGLVAIHLLTGLAPFDLYSVVDNRWIWPDLVTQAPAKNLSHVLHKLLERSLENRYVTARQALTDLKKSPTVSLLDKAIAFLPTGPALSIPLPIKALASSAPQLTERQLAAGQSKPAPQIPWYPLYQLTPGIATALALQGKKLAMGTSTGHVWLCDLDTGDEIYAFKGRRHRDRITALTFHPQGHTIYSACSDGTVKLWDLTRGNLKQTLSQPGWQPTDLAIAPPYLIVSDGSGQITLWDLEQLTICHSFNQHQDWVSAIATQGDRLASISRDRTLRLWSLPEKRLLDTLTISSSQGLALHPSGHYAIVGNDQGQVEVWTVGQSAQSTPHQPDLLCAGPDGITALALSPDARLLAVGTDGNTLRVYEGASGQCVSELAQGWGVVALAFDGHTLVSSSQDETVTIWQRGNPGKATPMT